MDRRGIFWDGVEYTGVGMGVLHFEQLLLFMDEGMDAWMHGRQNS